MQMINIFNSQYMGEMFFGYPLSQQANVVFDTGSNWLTVASVDCDTCYKQSYDYTKSNNKQLIHNEIVEQQYGSAELKGYIFTDHICLSPFRPDRLTFDSCV